MSGNAQVVRIAFGAVSFTAVCAACAELDAAEGYSGSAFAGRLDADLDGGTFLCRRGHAVRVQRVRVERDGPPAAEAAA